MLLRVDGVSKRFTQRGLRALLTFRPGRSVDALREVSLELREGEVLGLLGPNGAGKTTLLRILCDLVRPERGEVLVDGLQPKDARGRIGLVTSSERSFFWRLSGRENLRFFAALQGVTGSRMEARLDRSLARFGLAEAAERRYGTYSSGMKKRLALARALVADPTVLLMDEATDSLDAAGAVSLLEDVQEHVAGERGVVWATHRIEEVELLCDRVVILLEGRVGFAGTGSEFRRLTYRGRETHIRAPAVAADALVAFGEVTLDGPHMTLRVDAPAASAEVRAALAALGDGGFDLLGLEQSRKPLGSIFTELTDA